MPANDLLLRAMRREPVERTPVWLMRQAGRFDPEYRALREQADLPLEAMFREPELAARISLLPKKFGVDAIIFFQDILTPLAPMGAEFIFRPGPILDTPIRTAGDIDALRSYDPTDKLGFVSETLRLVRSELAGELPVLGFAGAPLTLAFFLIEGGSPGSSASHVRALMNDHPSLMHTLLDRLADMTADYLALQVEAGVDAVQLFESVADMVSREQYEEFAHRYHTKIIAKLGRRVPTILFAKEQPAIDLMVESGADVLSVGACVDLGEAQRLYGHRVAFQGNVDNRLLAQGTTDEIDSAVRDCLDAGGRCGHILNLNHGLLKDTPVDNVVRFIESARSVGVATEG